MAVLKPGTEEYKNAMNALKQNGGMSGTQAHYKPQNQTQTTTGATSGGSSGGGNAYASLIAQMEAQTAAAKQRAEQLAQQKREAAQAAYNKNMGYLSSAYANRSESQKKAYEDALAQLQNQYDSGSGQVNRNADGSQQEAYVNYMLQQRDVPQSLVAQGINGGAAESTIADMANSYGNNRNTIDKQRNANLGSLTDTLNASKSSAMQSYQSTLSDDEARKMAYQMELENMLTNQSTDILNSQYDALGNIDMSYGNQIASLQQSAAQAAAKNYSSGKNGSVSTAQSDVTKSAAYKKAYNVFVNGGTANSVYEELISSGVSESAIDQIMASLGL